MYHSLTKEHPLWEKNHFFMKELFLEIPFNSDLKESIKIALEKSSLSRDEYNIIYENNNDVIQGMIEHIAQKTDDYATQWLSDSNNKGVKNILHHLLMYQLQLYPMMPLIFKKVFPKSMFNFTKDCPFFWNNINSLWYHAGDRTTDYNYYSKRLLLSKIYIKTIFFAIDDSSDGLSETSDFIKREFDRLVVFEKLKSKLPALDKCEEKIASFLGKIRYQFKI